MRSLTLVLIIMPMWSVDWSGVGIKGKRTLYLISASQELAQQLKQSRVFIPTHMIIIILTRTCSVCFYHHARRERERERISCMSRPFKLLDLSVKRCGEYDAAHLSFGWLFVTICGFWRIDFLPPTALMKALLGAPLGIHLRLITLSYLICSLFKQERMLRFTSGVCLFAALFHPVFVFKVKAWLMPLIFP